MGNWPSALQSAEDVLKEAKRNLRAIFIKAESLFNLCYFEHAMVHFYRGLVRLVMEFFSSRRLRLYQPKQNAVVCMLNPKKLCNTCMA